VQATPYNSRLHLDPSRIADAAGAGLLLQSSSPCAKVSPNQWEAPYGVRPPPILLKGKITNSSSGTDRAPVKSLRLPVHVPPLTPPFPQLVALRPRGARRAALPCLPVTP